MAYDISNGIFHMEAGEETQGRRSIKSKHMVTGEYDPLKRLLFTSQVVADLS